MTDTVATPVSRRREATRQRLLDAAAAVFAEVGLDAASVEAVCERAGFTRGAFYSNFDSKEELFLELSRQVAQAKVAAVEERIAGLDAAGALTGASGDLVGLVERVLDIAGDDRLDVLLMSEIRIHSLRDPRMASAYLAQEEEMRASVARIIAGIARAGVLRVRVPAEEAARLLMSVWEVAVTRAAMRGVGDDEMCRAASAEIGRVAKLLIEPAPSLS